MSFSCTIMEISWYPISNNLSRQLLAASIVSNRNSFVLAFTLKVIVFCYEWFVASLCVLGNHHTWCGKGGRPPLDSQCNLLTYCLHYLYSLYGGCRWLLPHIPRKGWSHPRHTQSIPYISWCAFSKFSLYGVVVDHLLDVLQRSILKELKVLL